MFSMNQSGQNLNFFIFYYFAIFLDGIEEKAARPQKK